MTDRRYFVTKCPVCKGMGGEYVVIAKTPLPENPVETEFGSEFANCPACNGHRLVIAQVLAPLVKEEIWQQ